MARYIDADILRFAYEKSFVNDNHRIEGASAIHRQEHRHILSILDKTPTANVVPASEVEQLKRNLEQCENGYSQEMHLLQCKLADAKSEVERLQTEKGMIFKELEASMCYGWSKSALVIKSVDYETIKKHYTEREGANEKTN